MKWLRRLFRGKLDDAPAQRVPVAGETWDSRRPAGDPWGGKQPGWSVRILDVRDGWVRYAMNSVFADERMRLGTFLYCYEPRE